MAASELRPAAFAGHLVLGIAGAKLLLHLLLANRYGYFRDELYFLDCGRHLDWGYVDHAPMVGLVARVALMLGGSLFVLRAIAAVAGAAKVVLAGALAWRLGGGPFAQGLAALAVVMAPIYLEIDGLMTMNAFEPLFWMGAVYVLIRIVQTQDPRRWLAFGVLAGLGLMNKHSTAFFLVALGAGVLLSRERRMLATPWPWLGAAVALTLFAPNLVWQVRHGFPTLEDLRNVQRSGKNVVLGPAAFVGQQVLIMHPALFPLWAAGLGWLFVARGGRWRFLGVSMAVFFVLMFAMKAKNYYLAPVYPLLFAAGAVGVDEAFARWPRTAGHAWPRAALVALLVAAGALTVPLALPLLPPERYVAYERTLGITPPKTEVAHRGPLPQNFGDQFGWEELVREVAAIYHALPPDERARAGIFANNYGEAGAIDHLGPRYGLPRAISGHQTYFLWGAGGFDGDVLIVLQDRRANLERVCDTVEEASVHFHPWGMAEENRPIYVCRGLHPPLSVLWPRLKHWN
jgi:hypothetical protein